MVVHPCNISHAYTVHVLLRLFCVGDSIPCGFSKKSRIITGNRASFESFLALTYSLFCYISSFFEAAFIHTNNKFFSQPSDFLIQVY